MAVFDSGLSTFQVWDLCIKGAGVFAAGVYIWVQHRLTTKRSSDDLLREYLYKKRAEAIDAVYRPLAIVETYASTFLMYTTDMDNEYQKQQEQSVIALHELQNAIRLNSLYLPEDLLADLQRFTYGLHKGRSFLSVAVSMGRQGQPLPPAQVEEFHQIWKNAYNAVPVLMSQIKAKFQDLLKQVDM